MIPSVRILIRSQRQRSNMSQKECAATQCGFTETPACSRSHGIISGQPQIAGTYRIGGYNVRRLARETRPQICYRKISLQSPPWTRS